MLACPECFRKHIALAKSFAREILNGHGENAAPDHRIDLEGEISNAELHAGAIDKMLTLKVRFIRRELQKSRFVPDENFQHQCNLLWAHSFELGKKETGTPDYNSGEYDALPLAEEISKSCCGGNFKTNKIPVIFFSDKPITEEQTKMIHDNIVDSGEIFVLPMKDEYEKSPALEATVLGYPVTAFILWDSRYEMLRRAMALSLPAIRSDVPPLRFYRTPIFSSKPALLKLFERKYPSHIFDVYREQFPHRYPVDNNGLVVSGDSNVSPVTMFKYIGDE